jgi:tRNA (cytidine/uridine-2'-O-)-methyltransferase
MIRLALYQPDIAQNTGAMLRLGACLGVAVDLIEPAGFQLTDRGLARVGMDYRDLADLKRHASFAAFEAWRAAERAAGRARRLVLLTTRGATAYADFAFRPDDVVMVGRESAGVPDSVHALADARLVVPMRAGARSLNVALTAAMVLGEALRQTGSGPAGAVTPRSD